MMKNNRGFTLAELMIVITIISVLSVFMIHNYTQKIRTQVLDQATAQTIDIKRAVLSYFIDTMGTWPGETNNCSSVSVIDALRPYIGQITENGWQGEYTFTCPTMAQPVAGNNPPQEGEPNLAGASEPAPVILRPAFIITQPVPSQVIGEQLMRRLPGSQLQAQAEGNFNVQTFIPMALVPESVSFIAEVMEVDGTFRYRPRQCPPGQTAQVMVIPQSLCSASASPLFGYRIQERAIEYTSISAYSASQDASQSGVREVLIETRNQAGQWRNQGSVCGDTVQPPTIFKYCVAQ